MPLPPGVIRTALANMDREVKGEYQVLLQAKDMGGQLGGLASTTTINITLSDVNDNPPRFAKSKTVSTMMSDWLIVWEENGFDSFIRLNVSIKSVTFSFFNCNLLLYFLSLSSVILSGIFHLRVPESAPVGSAVGQIRAHDLDAGSHAEVDYAIVPGDEGNMFDIISNGQSQEGVVVLKKVYSLIINYALAAFDSCSTYTVLYQLDIRYNPLGYVSSKNREASRNSCSMASLSQFRFMPAKQAGGLESNGP